LDDLKDEVSAMDRRMQVLNCQTQFTGASNNALPGMDPLAMVIRDYQKDFLEMHKALAVRGNDTYKWFSAYSMQPTKQALSMRELASAI
jgi:hypothetical protein